MPRIAKPTPLSTLLAAATLCLAALTLTACNAPASQLIASRSSVSTGPEPFAASQSRSSRRSSPQTGAAPGTFDFYLLTLSWSPEFCSTHPSAAECAAHPAFVLHGLWPQNTNGTYPENCSNAPGPADPSAYKDIFPDPSLLQHEWATHGTCSGLSPDAYFTLARQAFQSIHIPPQLSSLHSQLQLPPAQILGDFAQSNPSIPTSDMALSCGNNVLTAVQVCLTTDLHATSCSSVKTCRANVVKIPPPGTSN
jgi:ribonuclease T2